jgi:hypothetical protein
MTVAVIQTAPSYEKFSLLKRDFTFKVFSHLVVPSYGKQYANILCQQPMIVLLSCQVACKMPSEPHYPTSLHPRDYPCFAVIESDFVLKGIEQFGHSSQDLDLEYKKYLVLLIQEQLVLVILIEKRKGE